MRPMNYTTFGRSGLRVSELCLGTMTFGTEWGTGADKATSQQMFDHFVDAGGNFFDTANRYTEGTSEIWLGEFIRNDRERFVVATKYGLHTRLGDINASGNHRKNMVQAVEASLRRLGTDFIDLYWLHAWDFSTPIEEVMHALDHLVASGKVLHIGVSDTPAWIVARGNTFAELRGWSQFVGLQVEYSLVTRDAERDLLPMASELNLAVTPWSPLGAGVLSGKYAHPSADSRRLKPDSPRLQQRNIDIANTVADVARELGVTSPQVALSWIRQKAPGSIPIVGARTLDQLRDNMGCLDVALPQEYMDRLDSVSSIVLGFPHDFLRAPHVRSMVTSGMDDRLSRSSIR